MKRTINNIVIINSVPINGGDEALLKATMSIVNDHFENAHISVLCNNPTLYKQYLPHVNLNWDWEYSFFTADSGQVNWLFKAKRKLRFILHKFFQLSYHSALSKSLASKREREVGDIFENADVVISSAGGYFHDFYGFERRLSTLEYIRDVFKKPYFIFYQSVGPFWETKNYRRLNEVFNGAEKVILRENFSYKHLKGIDYHCDNVVVSNDIAFYLNKEYGKPVDSSRTLKKIAINFRAWNYEVESQHTIDKAVMLCEKLLNAGYELSFISTCQGVDGYTNDTDYFYEIIDRLDPKQKQLIKIHNDKLSLEDFLSTISGFDAYIGMRLHGAILALIAGVPVLNIAYEDKSLGIFQSLKLDSCSFSFKESIDLWFSKVDDFILNYPSYLDSINEKRRQAEAIVSKDFKQHIKGDEF